MNHIYRTVFNRALGVWQVVAEVASAQGKGRSAGRSGHGGLRLLVLLPLSVWASLTWAASPVATTIADGAGNTATAAQAAQRIAGNKLPTNGTVSAGSGNIASNGAAMTITQNTQHLAINWQNFDIGENASVTFLQPNATAIALNRVLGGEGSQILGQLKSNGQVWVLNPNGVLFGSKAQVDVGGLVASTLGLSDADFMAGNYRFSGSGGSVINQGSLNGGYVALLGESVRNEGVITARLGTAALAAGNAITLDFNGDQLLNVQVDEGALHALADNRGLIQADGGSVLMTAHAKDALLDTAVNNTGIIRARTVENRNGRILLIGDMHSGSANIAGTLDASAPDGGNGGFIETSAAHVKVADSAVITTKAASGQNGKWLIDPTDFTVAKSSGDMTGAALTNALANGDVEIQSTAGGSGVSGDVNIKDTVNWSQNTLTLDAQRDINVFSTMNASGTAGLFFKYGQADAGGSYNIYAPVNLASTGSFRTQSGSAGGITNWTIITSLGSETDVTGNTGTTLQGIWGNLGGNFVLGTDIDASGTASWNGGLGFTPLGGNDPGASNNPQFTGNFDGLGHVIDSLTINRPAYYNIGLFGSAFDGVIANIGLTNASITGNTTVGGLAGRTGNLSIRNSYVSGAITGNGAVGGIVGTDIFPRGSDVLDHVWTAGSVTATAASTGTATLAGMAGGLIGHNAGEIRYSYSTADVRGGNYVGGLVGSRLFGSIDKSYFAGTIGSNGVAGSDGTVKAPYAMGALVGSLYTADGVVSKSYWNTDTAGAVGAGSVYIVGTGAFNGVGLTTAQMHDAANWTGFDFVTTPSQNGWVLLDGVLPMLASEWSAYIRNAHQLQLMALDLSADYTLANDIDASATNGKDVWLGSSFAPVGSNPSTSTIPSLHFQGTLDGQYHLIRNLRIDMSTDVENGTAGLFGSLGNSGVVRRVGLVNPVVKLTGTTNTGVGYYQAGTLAGENRGRIEESFALGADIQVFSATADNTQAYAGGLVGWNESGSTVTQSYATGTVAAAGELSSRAGGLIGRNQTGATLSQSWAAATVTATGGWEAAGGVAGINSTGATISNSIWDTSLITTGIGSGAGGVTGLDATQMTDIANFTGWGADISANGGESTVWRIYDGHTAPLLRGFLRQLTVSIPVGGADKTYDGQVASGTLGTYTTSTPTDASLLLGTLGYATISANAGTYGTANGTLQLGGLHSTQQGYDISYAGASSLTINKAALTVTANNAGKTYDATAWSGGNGVSYSGFVNGENEAVLGGTLAYGGNSQGAVNAGNYLISASGLSSGNYAISYVDGTLTIDPRTLGIVVNLTGTVRKTYDGTTNATLDAGNFLITGWAGNDGATITQTSGQYDNANAGSGKNVTVNLTLADYLAANGTDLANYVLPTQVSGNVGIIDKADATVTANSGTVTYNGQVRNVTGYTVTGLVNGEDESVLDSVVTTGGSGRNAGSYAHAVSGSDNNYNLTFIDGTLTINKAALTLSSNNVTKTYDGTTAANGTAIVTGGQLFDTDTISGGHFAYTDKNAGTGKTVTVNGVTVNDGNGGNNYDVTYVANTASSILQKTLTIGGSFDAEDKLYDGDNRATISRNALALQGVVAGDALTADWQALFADAGVAPNKAVTLQGTTLAGGDSGNYLLVLEGAPTATASISGTPLGAAGGRYASATQSAKSDDARPARHASSVPTISVQQCGQNLPAQLAKDCQ